MVRCHRHWQQLMDQESKGSLVPTSTMIHHVYILEEGVSICIILPLHHMTLLRLLILCRTIIHHVVSGNGVRLLLVLVFGAEGHNLADTGWRWMCRGCTTPLMTHSLLIHTASTVRGQTVLMQMWGPSGCLHGVTLLHQVVLGSWLGDRKNLWQWFCSVHCWLRWAPGRRIFYYSWTGDSGHCRDMFSRATPTGF